MNLFDLHTKPSILFFYNNRFDYKPTDPTDAFNYARDIIQGPFPKGEEEIAKDASYAYFYACYALEGPFPKGEAAIAEDEKYSKKYAKDVLKKDFYYNGKLIAKAE